MSEDVIARLKRTLLFKKLDEKENLLEDHEISENIISVVREIAPLLERIPENMPEFTLHNANHSAKVVEIMGKIIPSDTLDHLNIIELSILIYAAYLHDIGMTASRDEREEIIANGPEFAKLRIFNEELSLKFDEAKKDGDHRTATFIEDKLFTEFLRRNHVKRSHEYIKEKYGLEETPISWKKVPYDKLVQAVCDSHGLPVRELYDTRCWRRDYLFGGKRINVQYLSIILRLADILDLDPERTPRCLLDFINPKDETSIKEWKKHLSIIGCEISPQEISIEAECEHPIYERALREFIDTIETERKESVLLTSQYKDDIAKKYRLDLLKPITKENIRSNEKYIYSDFHFKLDFHRVIDLLMGERLYGDPTLTLRELLQNSVDAVRYRESLEKKEGNFFSPSIKMTLKDDELIIEDNGIGMDEYIFENYFLQIGKSYYNSSECRTSGVEIDPVSEFGIGILSIFMVASSFRVESWRKPLDPLHPPDPINVEIPTAYDYFVRRPSSRVEIGTKITLSLKSNHPFSSISLTEKISEIAPFIEYPITIETEEERTTYFSLPETLLSNAEDDRSKTYLTISFDETRKGILAGVKGSVKIKDPTYGYNEENNLIAQRGFLVKDLNIFPAWVNIRAAINLSNKAKLKLTPDRCKAIRDERYNDLVSAIKSEILKCIISHLKEYRDSHSFEMYVEYINELLYKKVLFNLSGSPLSDISNDDIVSLYFENVPLPCISSDGKQTDKIIDEFDSLPLIAVTGASDWENKIIDSNTLKEISKLIGKAVGKDIPLLLYDYPTDPYFSFFVRRKFHGKPALIYITSNPGVVVQIYLGERKKREEIGTYRMGFNYEFYNYDENNFPLFVNSPELGLQFDEKIIYNAKHPIISPFLDDLMPRNTLCKNALDLLRDSIGDILNQFHAYIPVSPSSFYDIEYSQNLNFMLIGILKRYPEILNEFSHAIEEFWDEAIEIGAISSHESFPGFDERDLPWFWNSNTE
ncbi:ATP-binding protein [Methanosarcina sp.]|uniref:HD domain-containing protein n=1 Tax=Methanosarcina sp. TaxID=2213 RepID=UPI00298987BC|nr:ATP-binding protein [Methanosarcina sp.]MDW5549676.1 ATP-binding protein [Methanosarcina sp.]MDW5552923.1 ATP-binding protein [Methanosarcina sp.]MDW5558063.1 ATP-binding protein [Methanosarcina sp.]